MIEQLHFLLEDKRKKGSWSSFHHCWEVVNLLLKISVISNLNYKEKNQVNCIKISSDHLTMENSKILNTER